MTETVTSPAGTAAAARPFRAAWRATRRLLEPLGLARWPLAADLATSPDGVGGRVRLRACRWRVGPAERPVAECRAVHIAGPACDIVNVLIFPRDPGRVPVFTAELLAFGGRGRLVFLDLQIPGLSDAPRAGVAAATAALATRYRLPRDPAPPAWAAESSTGGHLFARAAPDAPLSAAESVRAFAGYLAAWADAAARAEAGPRQASSLRALAAYKIDHMAHSPGQPFLAAKFGAAWTARFLTEFLHR